MSRKIVFTFLVAASAIVLNWASTSAADTADRVQVKKLSSTSGTCPADKKSRKGDTISYHYCGRLVSGEEFDCSFNYGQPYRFSIGSRQVIEGMDIGLTGVCVGDALEVIIPSHLAYGKQGTKSIPPDSVLIFYVKVLKLERAGVDLEQTSTIFELYDKGGVAYNRQNWAEVIEALERVACLHVRAESIRKNCTAACIDDVVFSEGWQSKLVKDGVCMRHCLSTATGHPYLLIGSTYRRAQLKAREVYSFLQMAYYKVGEIKKAAGAALTYFHFNMNDSLAVRNKEYFLSQPEIEPETAMVLEKQLPHVAPFLEARQQYQEKNYSVVVDTLEKLLPVYEATLKDCWKDCYTEDLGEFLPATGHMNYDIVLAYKKLLHCQLECPSKMENMGLYTHENLHADVYHHLQFSYAKSGHLEKAAAAMATASFLQPTGLEESLRYYEQMPELAEHLKPRQEAVVIQEKLNAKRALLSDISNRLPDYPLGDDGEVEESGKGSSGSKRKNPDLNLFSKFHKPVGPAIESLVP